ncbi:MAG: hypothetical protein JST38_03395 [Bacteroidetes bacterium]|nr:hypothetical protein [Bacteroidota bacterium]MBS1944712.1 hypothetical protein [Bacteroidota bacterium]
MTEEEVKELLRHPAFNRAVDRRILEIVRKADRVVDHERGYMPRPRLEGAGVVPHADAAKRAGIAVGTLINFIADGHVLGDAKSVHEPDLADYLARRKDRKK